MSRKKKKIKVAKRAAAEPKPRPVESIKLPVALMGVAVLALGFGIYWFALRSPDIVEIVPVVSQRLSFPEMPPKPVTHISFDDFAGPDACASCHIDIYNKWKASTHGQAGGQPGEFNIIGDFDGKPRRFKDATLTPYRAANGDYMFNLKSTDLPERIFKVDAVVGGGHMIGGGTQTYFSKFPDGTLRMLPFDFIRDENVWFGETSKGEGWIPITPDRIIDKESEWQPSRLLGTHLDNQNCQECHGSQIESKYSIEKKIYSTRYNTLAINCESCHGPGKEHIATVSGEDWRETGNIGLKSLATLDKDESLGVCFQCHSLKNSLELGYMAGKDLEDYYSTKFVMVGSSTENPYHPDGRIKEFAYQQNHESSDCYINGSMTCVDCHDPHSQGYRDIVGRPLSDPFDDGQCTSCHASKALNPTQHSFHKPDSPGNKCVSCHMPYLQHKAIGNKLRFARSDHTIPIPRPSVDDEMGLENACYQCHQDKSIDELQSTFTKWYGEVKPHNPVVAGAMEFKSGMEIEVAGELLLLDSGTHAMGQMAGLTQFAFEYLNPNMNGIDKATVNSLKNYINNIDVDIQSFAMASLHMSLDNNDSIHNLLIDKLNGFDIKRKRKVMMRWSNSLGILAKSFESKGDGTRAIQVYNKSLEIDPGNVSILTNLSMAYSSIGNNEKALESIDSAIDKDPKNYDAWISKGNILFSTGSKSEALVAYTTANNINPWLASSYFNIGNLFYSDNDNEKAILWYEKALDYEPQMSMAYFFLARSYIKAQNYNEAFVAVKAGLRLDPGDEAGQQMKADLESYFEN